MWDLLIKLIEPVAKGGVYLRDARKDNKHTELVAELFFLHSRLSDIIVRGECIVSGIETFVARPDLAADAKRVEERRSWIAANLQAQRLLIADLGRGLQRWHAHLSTLVGRDYAEMLPRITGKANAVEVLLRVLERDELPLELNDMQIAELGKDFYRSGPEWKQGPGPLVVKHRKVVSMTEWSSDTLSILQQYLADRDPRHELAQLRQAAETIRATLLEHFSLKEALMAMDDKRLQTNYSGGHFW